MATPAATHAPVNQPAPGERAIAAVDSVDERGLPNPRLNGANESVGSGEGADGNGTNGSDSSEITGGTIIIDSNNANNDSTKARMELTGTWTSANASPGYYGSGYWWAGTEEISAPATFYFYMPAAGTRMPHIG